MYSFKDLLAVDYKPGEDEQIKNNAKKRKRADVEEALTMQQRMKKRQVMRRMKAKIAMGRRKAMRRTASTEVLKKRAQRKARLMVLKKFLKGKDKKDLSYSSRAAYEKMVNRKQAVVNRLAKKLIPKLRQAERDRKVKRNQNKAAPKW